jgi:hypothetical protein
MSRHLNNEGQERKIDHVKGRTPVGGDKWLRKKTMNMVDLLSVQHECGTLKPAEATLMG